ncbi:hypothetical protein HF086_000660 [Spodoptera exigua]|uniref:Kinesin motor domain-containing protein n=1 Tax=Spodoptera exigua TaxID=7107 RepID=A0A922M8C5_SPOEX|nr:hypothetical protein HF086_000660 [Spodoptera exigua]
MLEQRYSDNEVSRRDIPSFIEPRPPLIQNPFMRPRPQKGTNLLELFEEDSEIEEQELVQVYLRLKPCKVPNTLYDVRSDKCLVTSLDTATAGHGRRTQHNVSKMYTFSKIFGAECNQREIFEAVVKDNLRKLPEGQNFTLLTYGASGSGKTYTLMGTVGAPGLVPRSLEYVFRLVDAAQQPAFRPAESGAEKLDHHEQDYELQWVKRLRHVSAPLRDKYRRMSVQLHSDLTASSIDLSNRIRHYVWVSFVEIYNEAVYDLLAPPEKRTKLRIREDTTGNVYVKGATQAFVRSGEEAYDVMVAGKHNLVVAATGVHAHSSRSHCIFTITMLTETCIESKLTRLLGTGLSGARGEAVSMVVTLNPSPEYAHETKHVLSLAAVAQDIQVNNTMLTTTLESSTVDTTIGSSAEVMKLRADNERLHFELVQAQARNKELLAAMEEKQQESANTMRELVEEAKDMTKQYYEAQLEALRCEMEDMIEEYESRLAKVPAPPKNDAGTPSRFLQNKVSQLMTEIAVLEEKLTAERLARARAEKEVEHLRTCIEERDEKAFKDATPPQEDVMSLSESEQDESDEETTDPFNESLEPVFKKELNRSISIVLQNEKRDNGSIHTIDNIDEECDSDLEESRETLQNDDSKASSYATGEDEDSKKGTTSDKLDKSKATESITYHNDNDKNVNVEEVITSNKSEYVNDSLKNDTNMTYGSETTFDKENESLTDTKMEDDEIQFKNESIKADLRGTYFVDDSKITEKANENKLNSFRGTYFVADPVTDVSKISETKQNDLTESNKNAPSELSTEVFKLPIVKQQSNADIRVSENVIESTAFDINTKEKIDVKPEEVVPEIPVSKILRGKSQIDMKASEKTEPVSSLARAKTNINMKATEKVSDTLVGKIIRSFKSHQGSDASLRQFEQLEKASKECDDNDESKQNYYIFGDIKILKEKRTYFDNVSEKGNVNANKDKKPEEPAIVKEKRTYFDNISANVNVSNKKINDLIKCDDDRSPSIVKDAAAADFEPSTIKKLLGESFTKSDVISSVHKTRLTKKHNSVDIFDGFDSPITQKPKECQPDDNVEIARKSIEKLVLNQLSAKKGTKTDVEPRLSIREVIEPDDKEVQINIKKEIKLEPMSSVEESTEISKCKVDITREAKLEPTISTDEPNQTINDKSSKGDNTIEEAKPDNTIEEFENIYKDITAPRATEFELLVSEVNNENNDRHEKDEAKYNLRKKHSKTDDTKVEKGKEEEISAESQAKCDKRKRNLRLRRRKNQDDESDDKLKDIVNLQSEFSDVTLDVPAPKKDVKDIPSPEKGSEENLPPLLGIQSCPSKSVIRSRRKLFTPRAEPLEESLSQTGDSNERIYVPRPSYHRPRARRKL